MFKLYNNQTDITMKFREFFKNVSPHITKTQLNFIPSIMFGMIISESCSSTDIAKELKEEQKWAHFDSIVRRINRTWNSKHLNARFILNDVVLHILNNYKLKHDDKRVHITFDHMFSHDNYAVFMFTMRVGTQGIPIYFEAFLNGESSDEAFKIQTLKDGIDKVHELLKDRGFDLIFLADRWFTSTELLEHIDSLGHTYRVRAKGNIKVYNEDGSFVKAKKLKHRKYHAVVHKDVYITDKRLKTNIVYSNSLDTSTPWIIVTNKNLETAIQDYSYRFGSIECVFKNMKSNGFNLEKISNMSLHSFTNMFAILCICVCYLTIVGADFSKNTRCYKNVKITTHKKYLVDGKKVKRRIMSLFNTGLTLFHMAFNSYIYIRLPMTFKLYDI